MVELAREQPGFLGIEAARGQALDKITFGTNWKAQAEHRVAQRLGRERWYAGYVLRIARVERSYGFEA